MCSSFPPFCTKLLLGYAIAAVPTLALLCPDPRKDAKSRSPSLGPYATKLTFRNLLRDLLSTYSRGVCLGDSRQAALTMSAKPGFRAWGLGLLWGLGFRALVVRVLRAFRLLLMV